LFQHDKRAKSTSDVKEPEVSNLKQRRSSMSGLSLTKQLSSHEIGNKSKSTPSSPNVSTKTVLEVEEEIVQIQVIEVDTRPAAVVDLIDSHAPLERKRSKSEFSRRERTNERRRFSGTDNISKFDLDKTFDETEKPIHEAASKGDLETLKRLIEESPLLSSCVTSKEQNTPLHIACMRNQLEIVQYLVEKNVDANALNKSLCTPLHLACSKGYMPIVEELVTKGNADITQRDGQGNGPFQLCVKFNRFELADYLMAVGSNIDVNSKTEGSKTLLHICGELGNLEAIKYLVERYGSKLNYNMKDNHGKHFLFCVLKGKNIEIIRYLAANVPEVKFNVIMQERGRNLIHQAVEENALPMIKVIHDVKPHLFDAMVNEKDKVKNQSPLHFAVQNNNLEIVSILVQWGANTNIQDSDGNTRKSSSTGSNL
jgi:ankyrin repeat protein